MRLRPDDAFYLDGEKLIEVSSTQAGVREYRARNDNIARVRSYDEGSSGPRYFVVETRAGLRMTYGQSLAAQATLVSGETLSWLCERVEDRSGNFMTFHYRFGDEAGVKSLDYAVDRIDFTGNDKQHLAPYASLAFSYESVPSPYGERFILGQKTALRLRLVDIQSSYKGKTLRRYLPDFTSTDVANQMFTLKGLSELGAAGSTYRPISIDYPRANPGWDYSDLMASIRDLPGLSDVEAALSGGYRVARIRNGSGVSTALLVGATAAGKFARAGYVYDQAAGKLVQLPNGLTPPVYFSDASGAFENVVIADIDGDGTDEVLSSSTDAGNTQRTWISDGNNWNQFPAFPVAIRGSSLKASGVVETDRVDASGKTSPVFIYDFIDGQGYHRRGAKIWGGSDWTDQPGYLPPFPLSANGDIAASGVRSIDVDGDGVRELVYFQVAGKQSHSAIFKATASGWRPLLDARYDLKLPVLPADGALRTGDFNHDNSTDVAYSFADGSGLHQKIALATPLTPTSGRWRDDPRTMPDIAFWREGEDILDGVAGDAVDVDGDGYVDLIETGPGGTRAFRGFVDHWEKSPKIAPPFDLPGSNALRAESAVLMTVLGTHSRIWVDLRSKGGSLVPSVYRYSPAFGWQRDMRFAAPIDISAFDKVDLGIRFYDLNNDGLPDILWSRMKTDGSIDRGAYLFHPDQQVPWIRDDRFILPIALTRDDYKATGIQIADINGDGRIDLMQALRSGGGNMLQSWVNCSALPQCASVAEGTVSGYWLPVSSDAAFAKLAPPEAFAADGTGSLGVQLLDVNGDGRADIVISRLEETWVDQWGKPSSGSSPGSIPKYDLYARTYINDRSNRWVETPSFRLPVPLARPAVHEPNMQGDPEGMPGTSNVDTRALLIDLDGDRLPDLAYNFQAFERERAADGTIKVRLVTFAKAWLGSPSGWNVEAPGFAPPVRLDDDPAAPERQMTLEDLNNDGNIDLIFAGGGTAFTYLNSGRGWLASSTAYQVPLKAIRSGKGDQGFRIMDINGDQLPDLVYNWKTDAGSVRGAFINTGAGFIEAPSEYAPAIAFAEQDRGDTGVRPLDVNGDGQLDIIQSYKRSDTSSDKLVQINTTPKPYLLERVTDGVGSVFGVTYRSFLALQRPTQRQLAPIRLAPDQIRQSSFPIIYAPLPGYLVAEVVSQGPGVAPRTTRYSYDGYRVDILSGRSLGFDETETIDVERDRSTRTLFSSDERLIGSPVLVTVRQKGTLISQTITQWQVDEFDGLPYSGAVAGFRPKILRHNLTRNESKSFDLDGNLLGSEKSELSYDVNSNPTKVVLTYADGSTTTTVNQYDDDTRIWSLGRLIHSSVTSTSPTATAQVREAAFSYDRLGLLASETALVGTPAELTTRYTRDGFGNKIRTDTQATDGSPSHVQRVDFDPEGRFAISAVDPLGHVVRSSYDAMSGVLESATDPNGVTARSVYDDLQRPLAQISGTGLRTTIDTARGEGGGVAIIVTKTTPGLPEQRTYSDAAGRVVRAQQAGWKGRLSLIETRYDKFGRVTEVTLPRFEGQTPRVTQRRYDDLDRIVAEVRPDGTRVSVRYQGLSQYATDAAGGVSTIVHDLRGRTTKSIDALGGVTSFEYDAAGHTVATTNALGQIIRQDYDAAGNRIALRDPTAGSWSYRYDAFGNLRSQVDPRKMEAVLEYDLSGRLIKRTTRDGATAWTYDQGQHAVGLLSSVRSATGSERHIQYDEFGRPVRIRYHVQRDGLSVVNKYDQQGHLIERHYDTGVTISNTYDAQGFLTAAALDDGSVHREFYSLLDVDAAGRITAERAGNGIHTSNRFDDRTGRLLSVSTATQSQQIQDVALTYDSVGNIVALSDKATGDSETYSYDALRRLVGVHSVDRENVTVRYDALGNILSKSDAGDYRYCGQNGLVGLLCSVDGSTGSKELSYDEAGNVLVIGNKRLVFNAEGLVSEIKGSKGSQSRFTYDADGSFESQISRYGPKSYEYETTYVGDLQVIRENVTPPDFPTPERTRVRHALVGASGLIGYYDKIYRHFPYRLAAPIYGSIETQKPERVTDLRFALMYIVKDQIGSVRAVMDENGKVIDRYRYDPWGRRLEAGYKYRDVRNGFAGHEMLDNLDLVHMGGRVYDPLLGRFLSADPIIQAPLYSQSYNRYSYVMNNPLVRIDLNGYSWFSDAWDAVSGFVGGAVKTFGSIIDFTIGKPLSWVGDQLAKGGRWLEQNWQTVAIIAISCVVPAAGAWYFAVLEGMALGGLSAALYGGGPEDILRGALIGGATAGAFYGAGSAIGQYHLNNFEAAGLHGTVGGLSAVAQGQSFGSGFLSAAVTKFSGGYVSPNGGQAYQVASAAVIGGVSSQVGGGSFENGAITGAFSRLFNDLSHPVPDEMQPSAVDKFVAGLPEIPQSLSDAVQGFGSGLTLGGTDWVNDKLGAGNYVNRGSLSYELGDTAGVILGTELTFAGIEAGGEALAGRMARSETFGVQSERFGNEYYRQPLPPGTWNAGREIRLGWSWNAREQELNFQLRINDYHVPTPLKTPMVPK